MRKAFGEPSIQAITNPKSNVAAMNMPPEHKVGRSFASGVLDLILITVRLDLPHHPLRPRHGEQISCAVRYRVIWQTDTMDLCRRSNSALRSAGGIRLFKWG